MPSHRYSITSRVAGFAALTWLLVAAAPPAAAQNEIVTENALTGNPPSEWEISGSGDASIQGFATDISVDQGGTVRFKIDTDAAAYHIDIYRLGWYGGDGARKVATVLPSATLPQTQPDPLTDAATGLVDCGNWSESASWAVPAAATSGVYIARLVRDDTQGASHVVFIVRDDDGGSEVLMQTSETTWQAYNTYGGQGLYSGSATTPPAGRAHKVSFNRPFITRGGPSEDWVFNAEFPMIRWLERNGYDVSYSTDTDSDRRGAEILEHQVFLSVGHDEYWSAGQRASVRAARDAGVDLAFLSGNEIYWKTRWEPSTDGSATPYRTLVCYKEGTLGELNCGGKCDPLANVWTGLWRDGCSFTPPADGCSPENALSGQISWDGSTGSIQVPDTYKSHRLWRTTSVATLGVGQTATLSAGTLGYEWDFEQFAASYPAGRVKLSQTDFNGKRHHLSLYRHAGGALVFGAGSVQWSWGLDGTHDRGASTPDARVQQATVNLLAEMGAQPTTLQGGLVGATATGDVTAPVSTIGFPLNGGHVSSGVTVSISGTAAEGAGVVGGVEVSVDGGATWAAATGASNWTYAWTPGAPGSATLRARAVDDLGNLETPGEGSGITVTIDPAPGQTCPCTIWPPAVAVGPDPGDVTAIEVGVKFRADVAGDVTGVRFYKHAANVGTHVGKLWTTAGTLLGSATFTGETATGWQEVSFGTPIAIDAGTTYIASVYLPSSHYAFSGAYFASSGVDNAPLHALAEGVDGPNGVYRYGVGGGFPNATFNSANYWVDLVFDDDAGPDVTAPVIVAIAPGSGASGIPVTANVTATFNEAMQQADFTTASFELRDPGNALVAAAVSYAAGPRMATLDPTAALAYSTTYTATMMGTVRDLAGNALGASFSWSFTTGAPPPPPPTEGPGGPILVISAAANPFSRYFAEVLRTEGLNAFTAMDVSLVTPAVLAAHEVAILGEMPLTAAQVTMLSDWVTAGGNLIAMRPDAQLAGLVGLSAPAGTLAEKYLLVNTASGPGVGIVGQTIQYHGIADLWTASGATVLATLYSDASTATTHPAVTLRSVGGDGGQAAAFTYDLARSIVYTRQGNPAWAGQERDGVGGIRSSDLFVGAAPGDPQPDWVDLNKVAIPQADEQQRLLANLILSMNLDRKPLPRFWYFPSGKKAVIIMTGDNHGDGQTAGRYQIYVDQSPPGCSVDDWECPRFSSYLYTSGGFTDAQALQYHNLGFETGYHINTGCAGWDETSLRGFYDSQLAALAAQCPSIPPPVSNRTHCIVWSDWATQPKVERDHGIRLDVNYYFYPPGWVADRPGMFTGSGMPMRFADLDGTMIDCYQATTQMTDESGQTYPMTANVLMDRALGPEGYYGAFTTNFHTDYLPHAASDAVVPQAIARGVPVVSGRQMLTWLDGRNGSSFGSMSWASNALSFTVAVGVGARNLRGMVPRLSAVGPLSGLTRNGSPVAYTTETIKGVEYALFPADAGSYVADYAPDTAPPAISNVAAAPLPNGTATITWTTNESADSRVDYGTTTALGSSVSAAAQVTSHSVPLTGLAAATTYYYRVTSVDLASNSAEFPVSPGTLSFSTPAAVCFSDDTDAEFGAGTTSGTAVTRADDGEVTLAAGLAEEFNGAALPPNMGSFQWVPPSGTATVAGGVLTVDGVRVNTLGAGFGAGHALEFMATFGGAQSQHVGFGGGNDNAPNEIFNTSPWAIVSTATGGTVYARTWDGGAMQDAVLPGSLVGTPHLYKIDWKAGSVDYYVDGVLAVTHPATIGATMRPAMADYFAGGATVVVDWIHMTPYVSPGSFQSRVFDAGGTANWGAVTWAATTPAGTSLAMSARTGDTATPDESWSAFVALPSSGTSVGGATRYIQYRADLSTTNGSFTPALLDVAISCTSGPDLSPPVITNVQAAPAPNGTEATITWTTDEPANSRVDYGTSPTLGTNATSGTLVTSHTVPLSGLLPGTTYYYRVTSADAASNSAESPVSPATLSFTTAAPVCFTDDTDADFGAGSTAGGTYVSRTDDGEVILAPAIGAEFGGTALPPTFGTFPWSGGGTSVVAGGVVTIDGSRVNSLGAGFGPGTTMEFEATFNAATNQHIGFGGGNDNAPNEIYNTSPWAMFSTGAGGTTVLARTWSGGAFVDQALPANYTGAPHRYRIDWKANGVDYYVDGVLVASNGEVVVGSMRPAASDIGVGGLTAIVNWIRLSPYASPGSFESRVFDGGGSSSWGTMSWGSTTPAGTSLAMSVRTGNTATPDGTWSAYASVPASGSTVGGSSRYIQYKADLATSAPAVTPALYDVAISCATGPDLSPPVISNVQATPAPNGTQATITWNTDEPADSRVDYGTSPALGSSASLGALVTSHSVPLSGLFPGTTYHYRVTSADAATNSATSPQPPAAPLTFATPAAVCASDDTDADFGAGSNQGGVYVSRTDDGEVILAPAIGAEFEGVALPPSFASFPWGGGGAATVSGGEVTIDGTNVSALGPGFTAGHSLEFVATFGAGAFQHIGFGAGGDGAIYTTTPWAMFSTGAAGTALQARTSDGGGSSDVTLPGSFLGASHRYRIDWKPGGVDYFIDGALVHASAAVIPGTMRPAGSDFNSGGVVVKIDWLRLTPHASPGSFWSRVFDSGASGGVFWSAATWSFDTPAGTSLAIATRTGNTPVPDGTWTAFIPVAGSGGAIGRTSRYLQYSADLTTSDPAVTPALRDLFVTCSTPAATVAAEPAANACVSTATPCVAVPFTIARTSATGARSYSVTFQFGANLALCAGTSSITEGPYLSSIGTTTFAVIDHGGGSYTVNASIVGSPCGATAATGTLFSAAVKKNGADGPGTITVTGVAMTDCGGSPIPAQSGAPASLTIDTAGPPPVADLVAAPGAAAATAGTRKIALTFTPPPGAASVEVWRKGFGHYPQYDEAGGVEPPVPASYPPAGWTLTGVTASGQSDEPGARDQWFYVVYGKDACGNATVSNRTAGTLAYRLGDAHDGAANCSGDNVVGTSDVSFLGANYGITIPLSGAVECLDVGPTTDGGVNGRPTTDNRTDFEDFILFAINYGLPAGPGNPPIARATPAAAAADALRLRVGAVPAAGESFDATLELSGTGVIQGLTADLSYDGDVVEFLGVEAGPLLGAQADPGLALSPGPGVVDVAVLGNGAGLYGAGDLARARFLVKAAGDPRIAIARAEARDRANRPVAFGAAAAEVHVIPSRSGLAAARPTPFREQTLLECALARDGEMTLGIYGVDGRRLRTLASGARAAGIHRMTWDGRDDGGRPLAAGIYWARLTTPDGRFTRTLVRVR